MKTAKCKIGETEKLMLKKNALLNNLKFQTILNCHIFESICDTVLECIVYQHNHPQGAKCHQDLQGQESVCRLMK